jgi:transposase
LQGYDVAFIKRSKRNGKIYLNEVENKWIDGKCVQKHIRYIGTEVDGETKLAASISDLEIEDVKVFGPLVVLHHIADEIGLPNLLGDYSPEILSLVYAHCLNYQSINHMSAWFKRTDLAMLLNVERVTEKTLLNALDSLEQIDIENLQLDIFNVLNKKFRASSKGLVYDVTNTYLYGKKCPLGKMGHDKEGVKGRSLIQIALAVTQDKGLPLFHKVFDGNIHDARTLQDLVGTMKKYKIKSGLIIYDRGITSAENIRDFHDLNWETLCGVPIRDNLKKILRPLIKKNFTCIDNWVKCNKTVFYVKIIPHKMGTVNGILAICFNKRKENDLHESRCAEIKNAESLLAKKKKIKSGLEVYFDEKGRINKTALEEAEEFDGYSCLFTTKKLSKEEIVRLYFDKDVVEKAFRCIKGITQLRPIRHWLYDRVLAHVMVCYLSYVLLSVLKQHLKKLNLSPEKALQHLDSMYKVYMQDTKKRFKVSRIVTLSKIQKDILNAIDKNLIKLKS